MWCWKSQILSYFSELTMLLGTTSEYEHYFHKLSILRKECLPGLVLQTIVTYYHKFLPNVATMFAPLYELLQTDKEWKWTRACWVCHGYCQNSVVYLPCVSSLWSKATTSSSNRCCQYGNGAVISHPDKDGVERPIAYTSRLSSSSEKNYSQIEKEALGIVLGVTKCHKYLYGRHFTLITDHKPLTIFLPLKEVLSLAALRMQRWALILMTYDYDIVYCRSSEHGNTDVLSRFPQKTDHS